METKMTAVEWLWMWVMQNPLGSFDEGLKAYNQAKAMEKEQIINAFGEKRQFIGFDDNENFGIKEVTGEQYYNETYGN